MDKTNRAVLVSGATGLQGAVVKPHLLRNGWPVHTFTRDATYTKARTLASAGAHLAHCDLDDLPAPIANTTPAWGQEQK